MNRWGAELLGFITEFFRIIFTPKAFLAGLASGTRSRWRGWGVVIVYLLAPLVMLFPLLRTEYPDTIAVMALGMVSFPALSALILFAVGGKLSPDPKQGREMALYSLAPLGLITGFVAWLLCELTRNQELWNLGFWGHVGSQDLLVFFPYWAPATPMAYLAATTLFLAFDLFSGRPESSFLWGLIASGNVIFGLIFLPLALWQSYFLQEAAKVSGGGGKVMTRFWLISGAIGIPMALMMVFISVVFWVS